MGLLKGPFEFIFGSTLTTITGPIGCGKSTLLTMIKASLTNTIPGSSSSWVSWGIAKGEPSYFTAKWELDNHILEITKPLADNKAFKDLNIPRIVILSSEGEVIEESYTAKESNDLLLKMLPVSPKVIDSHLIIDQDQITYPASATPAKFQETIHVLTKVNEMEISRSKLRESLGSYTVPEVADEVDTLQSDVDLIESELQDLRKQIADITAELDKTDIPKVDNEVALLREAETNESTRKQLTNEIVTFKSQHSTMETRLKQMEQEEIKIKGEWKRLNNLATVAKTSLATYEYKKREWEEYVGLTKELADLNEGRDSLAYPEEPADKEPDEQMVGKLQVQADETSLQHKDIQKKVGLAQLGCCPECGQRTDDVDLAQLEEDERNIAHLTSQVSELLTAVQAKRAEFVEYRLEKERHSAALGRMDDRITRCQGRLDQLTDVEQVSEESITLWTEAVENYAQVDTALTTVRRNIDDSVVRLETYTSGIDNNSNTLQLIKGGSPDPIRLKVLLSQQDRLDQLKEHRTSLTGGVSVKESELLRAQEKLSILTKRAASAKPIKKYRDLLTKAIDILHKNSLPKLVSAQYLSEINMKLNDYLTMVDADFSAWVDGDLQFMVKKADGLEHRANRLSGGQKQQVSIAYLLSVNDVFASSLGVLALDEPTGSMQEENAKDVAETFSKLVTVGKQTDRQFIVITHSETLASYGEVQIDLKEYV